MVQKSFACEKQHVIPDGKSAPNLTWTMASYYAGIIIENRTKEKLWSKWFQFYFWPTEEKATSETGQRKCAVNRVKKYTIKRNFSVCQISSGLQSMFIHAKKRKTFDFRKADDSSASKIIHLTKDKAILNLNKLT